MAEKQNIIDAQANLVTLIPKQAVPKQVEMGSKGTKRKTPRSLSETNPRSAKKPKYVDVSPLLSFQVEAERCTKKRKAQRSLDATGIRPSKKAKCVESGPLPLMHVETKRPCMKRKAQDEPLQTNTRSAKKRTCIDKLGSLPFPFNDAEGYDRARESRQIYPVIPCSREQLYFAAKHNIIHTVVFGNWAHSIIEELVLDEETSIPWQVPKVMVEYKIVDYTAQLQPYSQKWRPGADALVCPRLVSEHTRN